MLVFFPVERLFVYSLKFIGQFYIIMAILTNVIKLLPYYNAEYEHYSKIC